MAAVYEKKLGCPLMYVAAVPWKAAHPTSLLKMPSSSMKSLPAPGLSGYFRKVMNRKLPMDSLEPALCYKYLHITAGLAVSSSLLAFLLTSHNPLHV